jgi:23S rRNA pseudouridine1911/1915/1917 synthase
MPEDKQTTEEMPVYGPVALLPSQEDDGIRADRFLAEHIPGISRSYIQELVKNGAASVSGKAIRSSYKVRCGEEVVINIPEPSAPDIRPQKMDLDILYEDRDVLIVNKPKGLTVHPAPGHADDTLVNGILYHCGKDLSGINGVMRPGIVHRIDKDTSGALIICKNDNAHRKIAEQLKVHSITRRYRAIVLGRIAEDSGKIEGNIGRSSRDRKKMAVVSAGSGKPAVTHFRVLERFDRYTYCEFELETGRTHQIRVHMASVGHPILGDAVYGPSDNEFHIKGQALHAMVIGFIHPSLGTYVEFTAPLPEYFTRILDTLRKRR